MVKKIGFTISEAALTMAIIGIIVALAVAGVKMFNPTDKGRDTLSIKMAENIEAAALEILVNHCSLDNFKRINDGFGNFSIEDSNITKRMADLFAKYLSNIDYKINLENEYFSKPIINYDKTSTNVILKNKFSNFYYMADGVIVGFRFYQGCNKQEELSNPPMHRGKYTETNICGSIFYDINAFDKPNKLGTDQFILPVYDRGIKYNDN